jgi:hypothetical protein
MTIHLHLVPRSRMWSYTSTPPLYNLITLFIYINKYRDKFSFNFYQLLLAAKIGLYKCSLKGFFVKTIGTLNRSFISTDFIFNALFMVYINRNTSVM